MKTREILGSLLKSAYARDNAIWNNFLKGINERLLWYPSAGTDFMDLIHLANDGLNGLFNSNPVVIHSDLEYLNNADYQQGNLNTHINFRIPLILNPNIPQPEENVNQIDPDQPLKSSSDSRSGLSDILKPKSEEELERLYKEHRVTKDEVERYLTQHRKIELLNINVNTTHINIKNQFVLFFYWDNIEFFEYLIRDQNLPVDCIVSKRDRMDEEDKYLQFWRLISTNQSIRHLVCTNHIFGNMAIAGNDIIKVSWQGIELASLQFLSELQWDNVDAVSFYEILQGP